MSTESSYYGNGEWWLRSPNLFNSDCARVVYGDGHADYVIGVPGGDYGVVPALNLTLS